MQNRSTWSLLISSHNVGERDGSGLHHLEAWRNGAGFELKSHASHKLYRWRYLQIYTLTACRNLSLGLRIHFPELSPPHIYLTTSLTHFRIFVISTISNQ